jgi:hypothetical protein
MSQAAFLSSYPISVLVLVVAIVQVIAIVQAVRRTPLSKDEPFVVALRRSMVASGGKALERWAAHPWRMLAVNIVFFLIAAAVVSGRWAVYRR